jgi:SAM-dependent methyltransferase
MPHSDGHRAYFAEQQQSTREFWDRFGRRPVVAGKRVLDVGCGHGAMSIDLAQQGGVVVGVDTDAARIEWATRNLAENHPELMDRVTFLAQEAAQLPTSDRFDFVVSKDTFEHVADIGGLLVDLRARLHQDGELWAGFSPLYFSPWGDHGRTGLRIPWAHAVLPLVYLAAQRRRPNRRRADALTDIGLNGLTPDAFRRSAEQAGMTVASIAYNRGKKPLLRVMSQARRIPGLERYMTVSIYAVLTPHPVR